MKFIILSFKKNILPFLFILIAICLVIFSKSNLEASKSGLLLWANNVVPAVFPFFVITELLSHTNIIYYLGKIFHKIMKPVFNVPGEGAFPFIMGLISGYPVGGKIVADMREKGLCTKDEGERLLAFTNNSGPLFIISSVGISLFGDTRTGLLLLVTHILACITVGILFAKLSARNGNKGDRLSTSFVNNFRAYSSNHIFENQKRNSSSSQSHNDLKETVTFKNLGGILGKSINNAISTVLMIGGFVVLFSIIISILEKTNLLKYCSKFLNPFLQLLDLDTNFAKPLLAGFIELTNGVRMISEVHIKNISQNVILSAFLLGFGGISILLQIFSIISKTDLSIKRYIQGKFLQGVFAMIYTFIALKLLPFLCLDIAPVYAPISETITYPISFFGFKSYFLLLFILIAIIFIVFSKPSKKKNIRRRSVS